MQGFNSCSNTNFPAPVVEESRDEDDASAELYGEFYFEKEPKSAIMGVYKAEISETVEKKEEEEEFEFAFVTRDFELSSQISADEIFHNGMIRPEYPIINRNLLLGNPKYETGMKLGSLKGTKIGPPLRKLFIEERETATTSSSSSSEADELDGIPAETYCVWRPKTAADGRWKKSSSTGSNSKKWKLKDFLHRSHSVGSKDTFVFLSPNNSARKKGDESIKESPVSHSGGRKDNLVLLSPSNSGRKNVDSRIKESPGPAGKLNPQPYKRDGGEKRRSYLPYRQDLVGFFASVNGLSKNLQPF